MTFSALDAMIREAEASGLMEMEGAKIDFAISLARLMERSGITRTALAQRLGVSAPMATKILRGDTNVTIETMVKAARAAGGKLHIELRPRADAETPTC